MTRRLLITYLAITALTLAVVVVPLGRIFAQRERERLTFDIERDAQAVAALVEDPLEAGSAPAIDSVLTGYHDSGGRIIVVDRNGISIADSDAIDGERRDFSTRPEIAAALDGQRSNGTRASETAGGDLLYVALPVASGGTVHGAVRITYPTSTLDARVRTTWWRLALLCAVVLGLVAVVGVVFARSVTRPVRRLEQASRRLAAGDLAARVDVSDGPSELRSLAETFNTTAQQLGQMIESQHRFVADASHQLRTPLTALRLRLETLEPSVTESAQPKLEAAIAETDRLARLVQSLLVLARSDATRTPCEPVNVSTAVMGRLDAWEPVAADQGVRLLADCAPAVWASAVPGAVEQILDNLVSNALDAAPDDTEVTVRIAAGARTVDLHVIDKGVGMSAEARKRAFQRFWREPRRPGVGVANGFGLGLAIVDQLARHCGGTARLDVGPGGIGLDAVVTLPAAPAGRSPEAGTAAAEDLHVALRSR